MIKNTTVFRLIISNVLKKSWTLAVFMFFNIFIWKEIWDFQSLILFNLTYAVIHTIFFVWLSGVIKNGFRRELLFISLFLFALIFWLLSFLHQYVLQNLLLIGSILWMANGMYWVTFNNNYFDLTAYNNRWYYSGVRASLNTIWKIITPALIWAVISINYQNLWYQMAFSIWAIMFIAAAFIWNVEIPERKKREYKFFKSAKKILGNKKIFFTYFFYALTGFAFSNILLETLLPFLMYIEVQEEYKLWALVGIFSLLSVIVSYAVGKYISYKYYKHLILFTGWAYVITMVCMILFPQFVILLTAILTFLFVLYSVPVRVIIQNVFHEVKWYQKIVSENTAIQEMFIMWGRIMALVCLYFLWTYDSSNLKYIFICMIIWIATATIYFAWVDISIEPKHKKEAKK
jgi:hypothetical protein